MSKVNILLLVILIAATPCIVSAGTVKFNTTRDVWISAYPGEEDYNMGAARKLKLKGIQEMAILDFDLSALDGKRVDSARLYFHSAGTENKLRKIGISTVASEWVEGSSRGYLKDIRGHGATFNYASYKKRYWAGEGSNLSDVILGNGHTLHHHTELKRGEDGWWSVDLTPELIYALITGTSHGLVIMDDSGQTFANNYVHSRESGRYSPYLIVTFSDAESQRLHKPDITLRTSFDKAHMDSGAAVLNIRENDSVFAFEVYLNGEKLPLWRVPRPVQKGSVQQVILDWLPAKEKITVKVVAINEYGQRSDPAFAAGYASDSLPRIEIPADNSRRRRIREPDKIPGGGVWALPEIVKVDPVTGTLHDENAAYDSFVGGNPVWSAMDRKVSLTGCRGEMTGFQLSVDGPFNDDLKVDISGMVDGRGNEIPSERISLFKVHYLRIRNRWYPELAIPVSGGRLHIKPFRGQKSQELYLDIWIPREVKEGLYRGTITISGKGDTNEILAVRLNVLDILIPQRLAFVPELNMYSGPYRAGTEKFFSAHRLAHAHRAVINRVPYSQNGKVHDDMIPEVSFVDDGKVGIDWTDYDRRLGPLFSGTAFKSGYRKGIPVERFYLPFFENWPLRLADYYQYKSVQNKTQDDIAEHALKAPPIEEAMKPEYKKRFVSVLKEFDRHFEKREWAHTEFQVYLNNKWRWKGASSWWNLDEPYSYDDWMAIKYFGSIFKSGINNGNANIVFRADISRPEWMGDMLYGILDSMYVQDRAFFRNPERVRRISREGGIRVAVYGSLNNIDETNYKSLFWCMKSFVEGAGGVLPWQTLAGPEAFYKADRNAIIVRAGGEEDIDWVVSLRLKTLRRCQENVELMNLLMKKYGYRREQFRDMFYRFFSSLEIADDSESAYAFERLRSILMEMLLSKGRDVTTGS